MCFVILDKLFILSIVFKVCNGDTFNYKKSVHTFIGGTPLNPVQCSIPLTDGDIWFQIVTSKRPELTVIDEGSFNLVETDKPVKVLVHEWGEDESYRVYGIDLNCGGIIEEYKIKGKYNFIHVEWSKVTKLHITRSAFCLKRTAELIANFLVKLYKKTHIPLEEFHLIGFSLGAQLVGLVGKEIKKQLGKPIGRITALDPIGPLFETPLPEEICQMLYTSFGSQLNPDETMFCPEGIIGSQERWPDISIRKELIELRKMIDHFLQEVHKKLLLPVDQLHFISMSLSIAALRELEVKEITEKVDNQLRKMNLSQPAMSISLDKQQKYINISISALLVKYKDNALFGQIGNLLGNFIIRVFEKIRLPADIILHLGLTLGAILGEILENQVKDTPIENRYKLTKYDAKIVDVIHTDGEVFGTVNPIGTIDFYPNGGVRPQENCNAENIIDFCSHEKAVEYFIRSLNSDEFVGVACESWLKFTSGECNGNVTNIMGDNLIPERQGSFYLHSLVNKN